MKSNYSAPQFVFISVAPCDMIRTSTKLEDGEWGKEDWLI